MEISQQQFKTIANDILKYIKEVCQENDIKFYLAYGTALGAVRHEGFIPWDDDIDIFMTRDEYIKFSHVMKQQPQNRYKLLYLDESQYTLPLAKVVDTNTVLHQDRQREYMPLGIYVDVFIMDNVPDKSKVRDRFFKKLDLLLKCWKIFQYKRDYPQKGFLNRVKGFVYKHTNPRLFAVMLDRLAQKYNHKQTELIGVMTYSERKILNCYPKTWLDGEGKAMFEGEEYPIFNQPDAFLTHVYGDWRQLPPQEERVSWHSYQVHFTTDNNM